MSNAPIPVRVAVTAASIVGLKSLPAQSNRLVENLGFNSFNLTEFAMALEAEFGVPISEVEEKSLFKIADATELIQRLLMEASKSPNVLN